MDKVQKPNNSQYKPSSEPFTIYHLPGCEIVLLELIGNCLLQLQGNIFTLDVEAAG
jgi:hypothetical protein